MLSLGVATVKLHNVRTVTNAINSLVRNYRFFYFAFNHARKVIVVYSLCCLTWHLIVLP